MDYANLGVYQNGSPDGYCNYVSDLEFRLAQAELLPLRDAQRLNPSTWNVKSSFTIALSSLEIHSPVETLQARYKAALALLGTAEGGKSRVLS